ncbi:MAG: molybdopterin molybdotransferase MoeA [Pseudomonadota bacterium]
MISVRQAQQIIRQQITPTAIEDVPLLHGQDRRLAGPIAAKLTQPPFNASAMDGYACRVEDAVNGARLSVIGTASAGEQFTGSVGPGETVRIFTGAPVPIDATCIVIQENTDRHGDEIRVKTNANDGEHIRRAGIDFVEGQALLDAGTRLTGPALALAAAGNNATVPVRQRPKVALIANGDELVMPGDPRGADQIICSVPFGLIPMIRAWGGDPEFMGIAPDEPDAMREMAEKAVTYDLVVPIGGASVGDKDLMRPTFSKLGAELLFEKVAVKPGKPTWFAQHEDARILGLPGNPASALVTAILFVQVAIKAFLDESQDDDSLLHRAKLRGTLNANGPREGYLRAHIDVTDEGAVVIPARNQDSSLLSTFADADALIRRLPHADSVPDGGPIEYLPL